MSPIWRRISLNRFGPSSSTAKTRKLHLSPTWSSTLRKGHSFASSKLSAVTLSIPSSPLVERRLRQNRADVTHGARHVLLFLADRSHVVESRFRGVRAREAGDDPCREV